jgi:signal transduction histidine kinase
MISWGIALSESAFIHPAPVRLRYPANVPRNGRRRPPSLMEKIPAPHSKGISVLLALERKWLLAGLLGILLFLFNIYLSVTNALTIIELRQSVEHTHMGIAGLQRFLATVQAAETGQRGFLITGLPEYLEPYNLALTEVNQELDRVAELTADVPGQRQRVSQLRGILAEKLTELAEIIRLRKERGFEAARKAVTTQRGKQLMDGLRAVVSGMEQENYRLLSERERLFTHTSYQSLFAFSATALLALIGFAVAVALAQKYIFVRRTAEEQWRQSYEQLQAAGRLITGAENAERRRIGRDVDEDLGQLLNGMRFDMTWLHRRCTALPTTSERREITDKLSDLIGLADRALTSVRRISATLQPVPLDEIGLISAVHTYAQNFESNTGIACAVAVSPTLDDFTFDEHTASNIFRIIQELLTNVSRHADATLITITLTLADDTVIITVEDNGKGITPEQVKHVQSLGIVSMEERALLIGGAFTITGTPGIGTAARLTIPITPTQRRERDVLKVRS